MKSRTENTSKNIFVGSLGQIINVLLPFVSRTVLIYTLGAEYLGLSSLFTSILQILNLSELGISSAIVYSMYKPIADGDDSKVCALLNLYKKCYRIIGLIIAGVGLILLPFLRRLIKGDVPADVNIYVLYIIQLLSTVLTYELYAYRSSLLTAVQRNDIVAGVTTICKILMEIARCGALIMFRDYYMYAVFTLVFTCLTNIWIAVVSKRMYPQYICKGSVSSDDIRIIKKNVGGMIFEKLGGVILFSADSIVISAFLGLKQLGIYQNYYAIFTAINGFFGIIQTSLIASVGNSIVTESKEKNLADFKKFNFLYVWLAAFASICVLCLIQPFMRLWMGEALTLPDSFAIIFALYLFMFKWVDMVYIYQSAAGLWWENRFVSLIAAILNLFLNIILVQVIGLYGIVVSTIVSILLIYNTIMPYNLFVYYFKDKRRLLKFIANQLIYLAVDVLSAVITIFICRLIPVNNSLVLLINRFAICVIVPNGIIYAILHRKSEAHDALIFIRNNVIRKLRN